MFFITILILSTLSIASSAAFFSIYGLAQIFAGTFWPVVIMASSLEAGKLVAASYVYRYWNKIGFLMKTYLIAAILVLMMITSAGIFGFLSSAYQQDVLPLDQMQTQIETYSSRKAEIDKQKIELNAEVARMDAQIDAIPGNHSTNRRRMRESQEADRQRIRTELERLASEYTQVTTEQGKLRTTIVQQEAHTGPIVFIAKAFNRDIDDATKYMIFLIIFAFDPLAVILTIGANIAVLDREKKHEKVSGAMHVYEEIMGLDEQIKDEHGSPTDVGGMTVEAIEAMLAKMSTAAELTPEKQLQKTMLEEMLARKRVTERVRNPQRINKKNTVEEHGEE